MTDTMIGVSPLPARTARPNTAVRPTPGRPEPAGPASRWREAKTVLVTRVVGPRQLSTVPRLVIPIGDNQIAFRESSRSPDAEQLLQDGRLVLQPGDWRGNPILGTRQQPGFAQVVTTGTLLPYVQSEIDAKYRWRISVARLAHRVTRHAAPYGDVVILVTVYEPGPLALPSGPDDDFGAAPAHLR